MNSWTHSPQPVLAGFVCPATVATFVQRLKPAACGTRSIRRSDGESHTANFWNGGTLTTAGNLVFQGTADGRFVAYSADKGEKLWEVSVGTGVIASPVTYELDGVQYVSIMAGWGGAFPLAGGDGKGAAPAAGRLLTFLLNGKQPLPEVAQKRP